MVGILALQPAFSQDLDAKLVLGSDYRFSPARIVVPANTSFRLAVKNDSPEGDRFGSDDLNVEQGALPGQTVEIRLGPLKAGEYSFFGYLHRPRARAEIVVK